VRQSRQAQPQRRRQLVVGGEERTGAVEHPSTRPLELSQHAETGLHAVERSQDVEAPEGDITGPDPARRIGRIHEACRNPEPSRCLDQPTVGRSDAGRDDGESPYDAGSAGMARRTNVHHV
jgi:hypothetical protein